MLILQLPGRRILITAAHQDPAGPEPSPSARTRRRQRRPNLRYPWAARSSDADAPVASAGPWVIETPARIDVEHRNDLRNRPLVDRLADSRLEQSQHCQRCRIGIGERQPRARPGLAAGSAHERAPRLARIRRSLCVDEATIGHRLLWRTAAVPLTGARAGLPRHASAARSQSARAGNAFKCGRGGRKRRIWPFALIGAGVQA
jgi:hypothetical protein